MAFGERRGGFGGRGRSFGGGRRERFGDRRGGGFQRRDDSFGLPKPVKVGEEYNVKISDVGAKGDGITKIKNFIVFVAGTHKDDEIRVRIKEVANRFAIAEKIGEATGPVEEEKQEQASEEAEAEPETQEESESEESEDETDSEDKISENEE